MVKIRNRYYSHTQYHLSDLEQCDKKCNMTHNMVQPNIRAEVIEIHNGMHKIIHTGKMSCKGQTFC